MRRKRGQNPPICTIDECGQPTQAVKLCGKHYFRLRKYGNPHYHHLSPEARCERFWRRVNKGAPEECWEWLGPVNKDGYGTVKFKGVSHNASRVALWLASGREPNPLALHKCDNPICCNPNHLYEGTHAQNIADKVRRHRQASGEQIGGSVYKEADIRRVCQLLSQGGRPKTEIARITGVKVDTVKSVYRRSQWRHISQNFIFPTKQQWRTIANAN